MQKGEMDGGDWRLVSAPLLDTITGTIDHFLYIGIIATSSGDIPMLDVV